MNNQSKSSAEARAADRIKQRNALLSSKVNADALMSGDRAALSGAITLIESTKPEHKVQSRELLQQVMPATGKSVRIGITGVPGVGKSTFIESFGLHLLSLGKRVAVLAVDPSSPISGGSILGDKTRMERLSVQSNAFIRPSPSSTDLGGVTRTTREAIMLCEAAGFDIILIETVGVGQSETLVHGMTDFFLLLMLAGAGDQLQGIKRGIMEMCDGMLITKADGENLKSAQKARAEYLAALHLFPMAEDGHVPEVQVCSALQEKGIDEAWHMIERYVWHQQAKGKFEQRRQEQDAAWMLQSIQDGILDQFYRNASFSALTQELTLQVREGAISPFEAADQILRSIFNNG